MAAGVLLVIEAGGRWTDYAGHQATVYNRSCLQRTDLSMPDDRCVKKKQIGKPGQADLFSYFKIALRRRAAISLIPAKTPPKMTIVAISREPYNRTRLRGRIKVRKRADSKQHYPHKDFRCKFLNSEFLRNVESPPRKIIRPKK